MIHVEPSLDLHAALMARHTEYLQMADREAADTGMPKGDARFVYGQCLMMLLSEIFMDVHQALRMLGAKDDNLEKMVLAALERTKTAISAMNATRRARAQ